MKKVALAVIVILVIFYGAAGVVKSSENRELEAAKEYRESCEKVFISDVRELLTKAGYDNCGINLSRVGDYESGWEYTVRIHHHKLLDNEEGCRQLGEEIVRLSHLDTDEVPEVEFF